MGKGQDIKRKQSVQISWEEEIDKEREAIGSRGQSHEQQSWVGIPSVTHHERVRPGSTRAPSLGLAGESWLHLRGMRTPCNTPCIGRHGG